MRNPITRLVRYFQREYPSTSTVTLGITGAGTAVAAALTIATGGALLVIPAAAAGLGLFATGFQAVIGGEYHRHNDGSETVNGIKIVGDKKDVASVNMAQRVIDRIAKKYKHLPELPANIQRKVMAHVKDVEPALSRIRAYKGYGDNAVTEFVFTRDIFDARGRETTQEVAKALTMQGVQAGAPVPAPVVQSPKPVPAPAVVAVKPVAPEFGTLSKKVDAMEKRIEQIENPEEPKLEKPKLSAPTA